MSKDDEASHGRRASTSLFHSLKKGIFSGGEKTIDPSFENCKSDFLRLNDQLYRLKQAISGYQANMKQLFASSKTVCDGFVDALQDAPTPHPYQSMMKELRATREDMVSDRGEGAIALSIDGTVMKKLNDEIELHKALILRIAEREELRKEMDYYCHKVEELRGEREKRSMKGKEEKPEQVDKFDRNTKKYEDKKATYESFNNVLTADLKERWNLRVRTLGPAMNDFVACERQVLVLYATAVRDAAAVEVTKFSVDADFNAHEIKRQASRQLSSASASASAAAEQAKQAALSQMSGTNAMVASYAASSAMSEAKSRVAPIRENVDVFAQAQYDDFKEVGSSSAAQAQDIFRRATPKHSSPSSSQAVDDPWSAPPPMLSQIQGSGVGVAAAVNASGMNTDGSYQFRSPATPPPPPPSNPVFYGNGPISPQPPGGPQPPGSPGSISSSSSSSSRLAPPPPRPRMDSFGQLANRNEWGSRGEGEQPKPSPPPPPPPVKKSFNPFDD